jgi:metalloendopeptidase OMA1, mitochondrial
MPSRTSSLIRLAPALLALVGCATVPVTGRRQLLLMSEGEETALGLQSYQEVLTKEKLSTDPTANALVQRVGARIAAATGKDFAWEFKVVDKADTVNAFCLPGGKVVVYSGILPVTQDESGLATVIGHEVAHAIARHGGERVSEGMLVNLGLETVSAGMASKDPKTVQTVTGLLGAGATVGIMLPFSRDQESEADRLGLVYMAKAGYQPDAAVAFWKRMQAGSQGAPPEFLSDHPSDARRIAQIEAWLPEARAAFVPSTAAPAPLPVVTPTPAVAAPAPAPAARPAPPAAAPVTKPATATPAPAAKPAAPPPPPPPPPPRR